MEIAILGDGLLNQFQSLLLNNNRLNIPNIKNPNAKLLEMYTKFTKSKTLPKTVRRRKINAKYIWRILLLLKIKSVISKAINTVLIKNSG